MKKRGISTMVGYVLLISMGLIISVLVFTWAKTLIPKPALECPEGSSLVINDYRCGDGGLKLELYNNGKRRIDSIYLKGKTSIDDQLANLDLSNPGSSTNPLEDPGSGGIIGLSEGGAMNPGGKEVIVIPFYDKSCTSIGGKCTSASFCSGGTFDCSEIKSSAYCGAIGGCTWGTACTGATEKKCSEIVNTIKCQNIAADTSCEWRANLKNYPVTEIEITPERQQENDKGRKESVVCGDSIIKQTLDDCKIFPKCGDGVINQASETCDDGNTINGGGTDHCNNACKVV